MDDKKEWVQIATKLSPEAYGKLRELCAQKQKKPYRMLQNMCDVVKRKMEAMQNIKQNNKKHIRNI